MKKMWRSFQLAGSVATILLASTLSGSALTNSVPHTWTFEGMTNGQDVIDITSDSWYGEPGALVAMTTNGVPPDTGSGYPTDTTHTVIAKLSAPVTNAITGNYYQETSSTGTTVWVDHMIKPEQWKQDNPPSDLPEDTQMAYFVNTNGHVVVYHLLVTTNGDDSASNVWTELTTTTITSGQWARISIGIQYFKQDWTYLYYQVKVNGELAYGADGKVNPSDPTFDYSDGGSYFALAVNTNGNPGTQLNAIVLKGNGYLDDLVVTTNSPTYNKTYVIVATVQDGANGGSVDPSGSISVAEGSNQVFTVTASNYWTIDKVVVLENGVVTTNLAPTSPQMITFSNVMAQGSVDVWFAPMSTNGVPKWWMAQVGLTNANPNLDPDGDGFTTKEEYIASTDPANSNSYLRISKAWQANGTNYIQWMSSHIDSSLPPFKIWSSTNLTASPAFTQVGTLIRATTNTWYTPAATPGVFYRVSATNAP